MGPTEQKSLTQYGTRYIYQYFFLILCFSLVALLSSFTLFIGESWRENQGSTLVFVGAILLFNIIILLFLLLGLVYIFNGKREFDDEHESNVILATILLIVYVILFLIAVVYGKGFTGGRAFISAASLGFSSHLLELVVTLLVSIASHILFGYAMMYSIRRLSSDEQKKRLQKAFYLLVAGNFTLGITGLIAYFMYFKVFQEVHLSLKEGKIKAAVTAPCPHCNKDISIESKVCNYCGTKFDDNNPITIDPRLTIEMPKSDYNLPSGYAPIKGPTQAEKNKVIKFFKIIIAIVIAIVAVYIIYIAVSGFLSSSGDSGGINESNFVGAWSGGMFNGTAYLTQENWTFYDNGSLKKEDNFNEIHWNTYEISNEELCIRDPETSSLMCYTIDFSSDKTKVTLFLGDMIMYQFTEYTLSDIFDTG